MQKFYLLLAFCVSASAALPRQDRIVGGSIVDISRYPFTAAVLFAANSVNFRHNCGGIIINNRSVASAAHCWVGRATANQQRIRVGSTNANSGGAVHNVAQLITHPSYNVGAFLNNDIGILRLATPVSFGNNVRAGSIAGTTFNVPDNQLVWAVGWGLTSYGGSPSEQLRQVQLRTVNQARCQSLYSVSTITANMLCAGWDTNGRGTCTGDSGGPLLMGNVLVGITSFGSRCAEARFPAVFVRVSRFTNWIQSNS